MNKIFAQGTRLVDELGRERIFNGINYVDKSDYAEGEQKYPELNEEIIKKLADLGFNLIRLGFTWAKLEPKPGEYNDEYLDSVENIINLCEKYGIYVFLDMHQDLFTPQITWGDGAPKWAVFTDGAKIRPTHFVWAEQYFWGKACHRAFDNFWNNLHYKGKGLQDWYADCWKHIAKRFGDKEAVIGFDMLNEPFPGTPGGKCFRKLVSGAAKTILFDKDINRIQLVKDVISKDRVEKVLGHITYPVLHKATSGCDELIEQFDKNRYNPFIRKISSAIREVNTDKLLFLENSYYSNMGIPYSASPIEINGKRDPQQLFAPHAYDLMVDTPEYKYASDDRVGGIFGEHKKSQEKLGMPVIVGEWGGFGGSEDYSWLRHIIFLVNLFDSNKWSNTYWHYMDCHFDSPLMDVLSRPYPFAIYGEIESYGYDFEKKVFNISFNQTKDGESIICTPSAVKSLTVDGENTEYKSDGVKTAITTSAGNHTVIVTF